MSAVHQLRGTKPPQENLDPSEYFDFLVGTAQQELERSMRLEAENDRLSLENERLRAWAEEHNENADELAAEWQGEL